MKYALSMNDERRILSATYEKYAPKNAVLVSELPDGNIADYLYKDGEYIYDPLPDPVQVSVPTEEDDTAAMLVDHEYRLTLLELGLME